MRRAEMLPHRAPTVTSRERRREHRHAARVALGLLLPGLALLLVGHPELILYAVFGSFTGMYGRLEAPRERLRHQFHGAGMLVTGVGLGAVLAEHHAHPAVLVLGVTAFATVGSLVTDWLRLRPGGPFFGIFALGATATVGPGLVSAWVAVGICLATAVLCMSLGLVAATTHTGVRTLLRSSGSSRPGRRSLPRTSGTHALRYALATVTAGLVGVSLGIDHANWAMAAAAVPLAVVVAGEPLDLGAVVHRAMHRVSGTAVGLAVTALVLLPDPGPVVLAVVVIVLLFPTELFLSRHHGVALGFFTPLIMIMTELADPTDPVVLLVARGLDTVVGVAAGVAAAALVHRLPAVVPQERSQPWAG